ncbi:MAG: ABC transporter permease [Acidimicrobiales bacterium]
MTIIGEALDTTDSVTKPAGAAQLGGGETIKRRRFEFLYFALRNTKLLIGFSFVVIMVLIALIGPFFVQHSNWATGYFVPFRPPSAKFWFGTNYFGQDVFAQFVYGLRESLFVGLLGGCGATVIGMTLGFIAGYKGGLIDEALNVLCNVLLTIPGLVLLILIGGFLKHTSAVLEATLIACTTWTWAMRAIRAQTFSLVSRDFVGLARLSGEKSRSIIVREIAPNMSSYLFLVFILLFGGAILVAASFDFLGFGPPGGMSLGIMMEQASDWSALPLHLWWWFIPPGAAITCVVGGLYLANVGLDEVFNPKLRAL